MSPSPKRVWGRLLRRRMQFRCTHMPLDLQISHHVRRKTEVELLKIRVQWAKYLSIWLKDPAFSSFMDESRVELWLGFLSTYAHRYVGTPLRKLLDGYLIWSQTLSEKPDYWNRLCKLVQFFFSRDEWKLVSQVCVHELASFTNMCITHSVVSNSLRPHGL